MATERTDGARMLAYHNDPTIKSDILAQLAKHRAADELVQGYGYWQDGKGCAVGCTLYSGDHMEYETRFGIPVMIARLEDCIFEWLPVEAARAWPERLMSSIAPGADLSRVGWQFLYWLLTDEQVNPGISHPTVRDAARQCADVIAPMTKGLPVDPSAAWSAESAAESAAWSAAWSAAGAAESAAKSAAYVKMADKLITLIEAAAARKEGGLARHPMTDTPTRDILEQLHRLEADLAALASGKVIRGKFAAEMMGTAIAAQAEIICLRAELEQARASMQNALFAIEQGDSRRLEIGVDSAEDILRAALSSSLEGNHG